MRNTGLDPSSMPINDRAIVKSRLEFMVVGIGASAGGLQALIKFLEQLPADNGMAFVIVMHLAPNHQSSAAEILQRATKMPVSQVNRLTPIEKNHVYVIPPNKHLTMSDGSLGLSPLKRDKSSNIAIDVFFRTLAEAHQERAIGIVMSGTGADGAVGISRLKEQGGMVLAQLPADAEYDGMPLAAIATGFVDFTLPVVEMPQKLLELWGNAQTIVLPAMEEELKAEKLSTEEAEKSAEAELYDIISLLRSRTGHDFRHYKRATVLRRLERRMQVRGASNLHAYHNIIKNDAAESGMLLKDMLIGVTNFFRDRESFEALERDVIPRLFEGKRGEQQVRVWVAGCSSGEEAYSIAMLLSDQQNLLTNPPQYQVFASDIDEEAIMRARAGSYPASIVLDVPPPRLREYFTQENSRYQIKKTVRDKILFASHNLLRDPPFSKVDLISCRNLLIYLNREIQSQVLEMFHFALNPNGLLFLGSSESADTVDAYFTPVDKKNRIYRAKPVSRSSRYEPAMSFVGSAAHNFSAEKRPGGDKRKFLYAEVHQRVLAQHAPPSVIINSESNIMHMSDRAGRFLRHIGGEPTRNLILLVLPELRLELRTAIIRATQSGKSVEARGVPIQREGTAYSVTMTARPFHDEEAGADFVLVLFEEVEETMSKDEVSTVGEKQNSLLTELEEELHRTKEILQNTIEHSETSNEELKASNEELQAINEELRSASEELETSKEELQSLNEELITVNSELKAKVEETGKINDDLNNLIASTNIATIFVDRGIRIKRYTPRAVDIFNIIPNDIGRSLLDITHRLDYDNLAADAAETFETLRLVEREVSSNDGRYYIARLLPYRTVEDRIDGAVLTFIDITERRLAEEKLQAEEQRMQLIAESSNDYAIITGDTEGRITSFNKGATSIFGYSAEEAIGQSMDILFTPEDRAKGVPDEERERARKDGRAEDDRWHLHKNGTLLYCSGVMTPLQNNGFFGYAKIARNLIRGDKKQG